MLSSPVFGTPSFLRVDLRLSLRSERRGEALDLQDRCEAHVPQGLRTESHIGKGRVSDFSLLRVAAAAAASISHTY